MADKVTKICMDIYRKLEKRRVLNIERLQIPNISDIFLSMYFTMKICLKIYNHASIFLFISSVLNPVWIRLSIDCQHPLVCRKRRLNGVVLRMRPEKPRSRVTAGVAR
jgi:hypothetical protein